MVFAKVFSDEFRNTCQKWRQYFTDHIESSGQTVTKARALIYLSESDKALTQRELACLLSIEEPSVVRMLDGLEKDGLVQRKMVAADRRSKHIILTEAAVPVVALIQEIAKQASIVGLQGIPTEKLLVAYEVLQMIARNVEQPE